MNIQVFPEMDFFAVDAGYYLVWTYLFVGLAVYFPQHVGLTVGAGYHFLQAIVFCVLILGRPLIYLKTFSTFHQGFLTQEDVLLRLF